jgi:hypothetical protein
MKRIKDEKEVVDRYYVYEGDSIAGENFEYEDDAIDFAEELVERGTDNEVIVERRTYTTYDDGGINDADTEEIWSSYEDYISDGYNGSSVHDSRRVKDSEFSAYFMGMDDRGRLTFFSPDCKAYFISTERNKEGYIDYERRKWEDKIYKKLSSLESADTETNEERIYAFLQCEQDIADYYDAVGGIALEYKGRYFDSEPQGAGYTTDWELIPFPESKIPEILRLPDSRINHPITSKRVEDSEATDIRKAKNKLIKKAQKSGIYENFGQDEVHDLKDKYGYTAAVEAFDDWCMNYDGHVYDSIKTKVSARKKVTDALAKFFQKDLKNLQAFRRVTDSKGKIKENVVFLIEDSDVLAVFPNTYGTASRDKDTMTCYSHNGQHGVCTYDYANTLKTADSYDELKDELTNYVGYNLNIIDSLPAETELQQNAKEIKDAYIKHKRQAIADERMLARGEEIEYKGKRGTVQYALFHGQEPVIIRWQNEEGSEEFEVPYNEVRNLKIHDSEDTDADDVNVEQVDSDTEDAEVTDNCGKGKKKAKDSVKKVKVFKRNKKA